MPPTHKPNETSRKLAKSLSGIGVPQEDICHIMGVTKPTLHKHYRLELDQGLAEANAKVAGVLYNQAISGNITALIFWTKSRMGWREVHETNVNHKMEYVINAEPISRDEWLALYGNGDSAKPVN